MNFKIFSKKEKLRIENKLKEQFGIEKIQGILVKRGEERIFLFQGNLTIKEIKKIEEKILLERVGIYFAKEQNNKIRLSLEGVYLLKEQIKKNIFELNDKQAEQWMLGQELPIRTRTREFLIMKYKDYFLGCGKASEEKIGNFIPKNRRLKYKEKQ
jgi:NOL1/NOP2/fmu family ribosome biogenesis protein